MWDNVPQAASPDASVGSSPAVKEAPASHIKGAVMVQVRRLVWWCLQRASLGEDQVHMHAGAGTPAGVASAAS